MNTLLKNFLINTGKGLVTCVSVYYATYAACTIADMVERKIQSNRRKAYEAGYINACSEHDIKLYSPETEAYKSATKNGL